MTRRLLAAASAIALFAGTAQAETVLHILHTNDVHSRIEPISDRDSTCDAEQTAAGECFGGMARIATKIKELRDRITADAKARAQQYAELSGLNLGDVVSISEASGSTPPPPMPMPRGAMAEAVPLSPGQQTVGFTVTAVWELS